MSVTSKISDPDAEVVVNEMLEQTHLAALTRDFDLFFRWCSLPHVITTFDKKRVVSTMDEMKAVFKAQCDNFATMQVTDMIRTCQAARFDGPDCIKETHTTHLMSGDRRVIDPYPAYMVLELKDSAWRVSKSDYAVKAGSGFEKALGKDVPTIPKAKELPDEQ